MLLQSSEAKRPFHVAILDFMMPDMDGQAMGRAIKEAQSIRDTRLILLTSCGQRGDAKKIHEIGFAAYLTKPVRYAHLFDALKTVLGLPSSPSAQKEGTPALVTRHSIAEAQAKRRQRILLVEDNKVNQKLAVALFKKMGYPVDAVGNGREAIEALQAEAYDLVFMDVQMPEMDGYQATKVIRDPGSAVKNHRVPIIAMTANAMKGDRERCLEVGMDDYVSKPIRSQKLQEMVDRFLFHSD